MTSQQPEVVLVGGGLIGLAIAWRAALAGMSATVCDAHAGGGASAAAAGLLAPVTEVHYGEERLLQLNLEAAGRWQGFAAQLAESSGIDPGYRRCGTVMVARDVDDRAVLLALLAFQRELGLRSEPLASRELRALEPGLAHTVRGGLHVPDDHQVDNRACLAALRRACERAGVRLHAAHVAGVLQRGGRVTGVRCDDGQTIAARTVVIAAGAWSGQVEGIDPGARPPIRPVKGQLLHLRSSAEEPLTVRNVRGLDCYVATRAGGEVVLGGTVEERGFDLAPTAGAVADLLHAGRELLPGIAELDFAEVAVGLRPATPDNAPLIGPAPGMEGLVYATGHYRNGVLLTPVTADLVVELLDTGKPPERAAAFAPERFAADLWVGA